MIRCGIHFVFLALLGSTASAQQHWAYLAPRRPDLPAVRQATWPRGAIDRFILARLEAEGIAPSSPAERATMLRRVTLDLTGLPPTRDELAHFLADTSPDAYERQVDRLLASPHYGEQMAVAWLDLARYADTHGYHSDSERDMWRWRDWLVEALNADLPFDQFTIEQLAGDLLPNATLDQRLATGFHRNHMLNNENGAIPEEYQAEYVIERTGTTGTVWLGQTVACARCHDHKHDPLSQREFYQLSAFFNNVPENGLGGKYGNSPPTLLAPTRPQRLELDALAAQGEQLQRSLAERMRLAAPDQAAWEQKVISQGAGLQLPPDDALLHLKLDETEEARLANSARGGESFPVHGNATWAGGKFGQALLCDGTTYIECRGLPRWDRTDAFTLAAWIFPTTGDAMSIAARFTEAQYRRGFDFGLEKGKLSFRVTHEAGQNELFVQAELPLKQRRWQHVAASYDGSGRAAGVAIYLDGQPLVLKTVRDDLSGHIQSDLPICIGRGDEATYFRGLLDEVQIFPRALSAAEADLLAGGNPIADILRIPPQQRTPAQAAAATGYFLENVDPGFRKLNGELKLLEQRQAEIQRQAPTVMVMQELPQPRDTFVLNRGLYDEPGEKVTAGTPAFLPPMPPKLPRNRLGLAQWLMAAENPLTARVAVNRQWQAFFGTGLVRTADDFGTHGEPPSHPELLDWLAREFADTGWNVKRLQRQVVTSSTYRQTSEVTAERRAHDPDNRLLARGPRQRLPAETIRDSALAAAGILDLRIGGLGVRPYQPAELWRELAYDTEKYTAQVFLQSHGADLYRRSLYTFWKRTVPPPDMALFDAPSRETCTVTRARGTSPLQALVLLNDTTYVEAARALAARVLQAEGGKLPDEMRLQQMFELVLSRGPTAAESAVLLKQLAAARRQFLANPIAAKELLQVGELPTPATLDPPELAAWTTVASVLLNLHETVTKR